MDSRRKISVVIPTLNEAPGIEALVRAIMAEEGPVEAVVVDGGSADNTRQLALEAGAKVITAERGRGPQLCAGALAASGDVLLFLHADSKFPTGGLAALRDELDRHPEAVGGNFHLHFGEGTAFSDWLDQFYAGLRRRGFYYGDSGIFAKRQTYEALGGIRPLKLMEDYDFVRRMEGAGETVCVTETPLVTSSRRFLGRSKRAIVWGWLLIHVLFHLKVPTAWLARLYDTQRRRPLTGTR